MTAHAVAPAVVPSRPSAPRRRGRAAVVASLVALLGAAGMGAGLLVWRAETAPSYGPPALSELPVTVAPHVSVEVIASHRSLADRRFDDFDVSPRGSVVVVSDGQVFDLAGGDALLPPRPGIRSVAFAGGSLAMVDERGVLGYLDGDRFASVGPSPVRAPRLVASPDGSRLFLFATAPAAGDDDAASLAEVVSGSPLEVRAGSLEPLLAASGDDASIVFSIDDCLFRLTRGGHPRMIMKAPDPDARLVGLALAGRAIYFSTRSAVYALEGGLAFPLAKGVGGELRVHEGAIFVLDAATRRLFRVVRDAAQPEERRAGANDELAPEGERRPRLPADAPSDAEWDAVREVTVTGSSALACETKVVGTWFRVVCRTTSAGQMPTAVEVVEGDPQVVSFTEDGTATVLSPYRAGASLKAIFSWGAVHRTLVVRWPAGTARPARVGVFQ